MGLSENRVPHIPMDQRLMFPEWAKKPFLYPLFSGPNPYGGVLKYPIYHQLSSILSRIFHKSSIWGYHHLWKPPLKRKSPVKPHGFSKKVAPGHCQANAAQGNSNKMDVKGQTWAAFLHGDIKGGVAKNVANICTNIQIHIHIQIHINIHIHIHIYIIHCIYIIYILCVYIYMATKM